MSISLYIHVVQVRIVGLNQRSITSQNKKKEELMNYAHIKQPDPHYQRAHKRVRLLLNWGTNMSFV